MKKSGILLHITSLPSKYGIGCFSKEAFDFVDKLAFSKQTYWQILPLGPTSYGDSPYQSFSTFAINPYFIDLEELIKNGSLKKEIVEKTYKDIDCRYIDYEYIYNTRYVLLRESFENVNIATDIDYISFIEKESNWLDNYSLFMSLKSKFGGVAFHEWPKKYQIYDKEFLKAEITELEEEISFHKYMQYIAFKQWMKLKEYANSKGIKIIGDIPIYVALDSSDVWSNQDLFDLDSNSLPNNVAGCPPDYFAKTGQLWGNPLYKWDYLKKIDYSWWIKRIEKACELYDVTRIDHFRGFDEFYSVPYTDKTAENGNWIKGPSYDLFKVVKEKVKNANFIAEDLGFITDSVRELLKKTSYPGMKILQFGFDEDKKNEYNIENYVENSVAYTGTHDNQTLMSWFFSLDKKRVDFIMSKIDEKEEINFAIIKYLMSSKSNTCIIPLQDYMGLGDEARINTPSTIGDNWKWRVLEEELTNNLLNKIKEITLLSLRG